MKEEKITCVKALDKDFSCRGLKYEIGKSYQQKGEIESCANGFHACENPLDVLQYYSLTESRFAIVELSGEMDKSSDYKIAAAKIEITAELKLPDFIKRSVNFLLDLCKKQGVETSSGNCAQLAASGDYAQLAASGDYAQLAASGNCAQLAASGNCAQLAASGDCAKLAASGDYAQLAASGNCAQLTASGNYAQLAASGDCAQLTASGNYAQLAASGENSVIASSSVDARAKGKNGTWISLAKFDNEGCCVGFCTGRVGENGIKEDVYYKAKDGVLTECE